MTCFVRKIIKGCPGRCGTRLQVDKQKSRPGKERYSLLSWWVNHYQSWTWTARCHAFHEPQFEQFLKCFWYFMARAHVNVVAFGAIHMVCNWLVGFC